MNKENNKKNKKNNKTSKSKKNNKTTENTDVDEWSTVLENTKIQKNNKNTKSKKNNKKKENTDVDEWSTVQENNKIQKNNKTINHKKNSKKQNKTNKSVTLLCHNIGIKLCLYFMLFSLLSAKCNNKLSNLDKELRFNSRQFFTSEIRFNIAASSFLWSSSQESNHARYKQKNRNKQEHIKNGNKQNNNKKIKKKKYIKIIQINKGKSNIKMHLDIIKMQIQKEDPGIVIITESQITTTDTNLNEHFKNYTIENKFLPGLDRARISILIKNTITYQRVPELEDDWISNIWLRVSVSRNKTALIMGGYREWKHPQEANKPLSGDPLQQEGRLSIILDQIARAKALSPTIVFGWDSNLDLFEHNDNSHRHDIKNMLLAYTEFMQDMDLTLLNTETTRHWSGTKSSLLDHFVTNKPGKVDNIKTYHSCVADHDFVSIMLHTDEIIDKPQLMLSRDWSNLNRDNLINEIKSDEIISSVFTMTSSDRVWNDIIIQLNIIINRLAPSKIVQLSSNFVPYQNSEISNAISEANAQLTCAIQSNDIEEWRAYRALRNLASKIIKKIKGEYYTRVLNNTNALWKSIKLVTNDDCSTLPRRIIYKGLTYTSIYKIASISNIFFKDKIEDIRKSFKYTDLNPIAFLDYLIPKPASKFHLPEITIEETTKIIKDMKCSNTCGHDAISSRIIKLIPDIMAPLVTHAINTSIRTSIFPKILKVSRILPISKKDKPKNSLEGYRPIHNLHTLEKVYEQWIKQNLTQYIEENEILTEEHHGGRKCHSTLTAKCLIDYYATKTIEKDQFGVILSTDLSSAFDTVDHKILFAKLHFYGIQDNELSLIKSYYKERNTFVQIDTKRSKLLEQGEYGVVQGSKLSGLIYSIYTNEVPKLHNILFSSHMMQEILQMQPLNPEDYEHTVAQFVDDSNSVIIVKDKSKADKYINLYFLMLKIFYNMNKLKINDEKTNLMIICNPKHEDIAKITSIRTDKETIKPKEKFKILGWIQNRHLNYNDHINHIASIINHRIHRATELKQYMSTKTRTIFCNTYLFSVLNYGAPLMSDSNEFVKKKMHFLHMKICRYARGNYGFKISCKRICNDIGKKTSSEEFQDARSKLSQRIIYNQLPKSIYSKLKMPRSRYNAKIGLKLYPNKKKFKSTFINTIPSVYNAIPSALRGVKPKIFKKKIKKLKIGP